ncbi:MAG: cupin domain-containing protein [Phycisphaerales bacterium]|nr:cupin domain-containing protein [Phycisphaerales bacterium]
MSDYRVDFTQMPWETPIDGLRFKALRRGGRQLRLVEYGKDMAPHICAKGHIGFVLEGRMELRFANEVTTLNPGDGLFIPSGEQHQHETIILTDVVRMVMVEDL